MKEASGELNLTVITVVAIAAIAAVLWGMWPTIKDTINNAWNDVEASDPDTTTD